MNKHLLAATVFSLLAFAPVSWGCAFCNSSKGMQIGQPKTPAAADRGIAGGAKIVSAVTPKQAGFSDGFFNSVGSEERSGRDESNQPVAVPNGDGEDYKVIFR